MQAGRETDKAVAEALGWSLIPVTEDDDGEKAWDTGRILLPVYAFNPSTLISDAWLVLEKVWTRLPKTGCGTYRFQLNRRDSDGWYVCEFAPDAQGDWRTHATGEAPTAPLAICRAALRALGVEQP
jgi:hypothetical protein